MLLHLIYNAQAFFLLSASEERKKRLQIILDVTSNCLDLTDKEDDITSAVPDPRFVCSGWQNPSPGNR